MAADVSYCLELLIVPLSWLFEPVLCLLFEVFAAVFTWAESYYWTWNGLILLAAANAYCDRAVEVLLLSLLSSLVALDDLCYTLPLPLVVTFYYLPRVLLLLPP